MRTFFTALLFLALPGLACAQYRGDVPLGETINFTFNTIGQDGAPITMGGTPEIVVYEEGNTTPITSADALAEDFGSVTGLHNVEITATSGNGFEAGKWYDCVIAGTTPTADSVSIAGRTVGTFRVLAAETVAGLQATDVAGVGGSTAAATTLEEGLNASGVYLTLYVDASAAGDADGRDKTNAYTTINAALAALDGDIGGTIYVAAGTYAENVVVSKSNVTIIGVTGATVNAGTGVSITVNEDNVTLIGMEADATAGTDLSLGAVDGFRAHGCTFANAISIGSALDTPNIQYTSVAGTYYRGYSEKASDPATLLAAVVTGYDDDDETVGQAIDHLFEIVTDLNAVLSRTPTTGAITNINTVFETDFATAYDTTVDRWNVDLESVEGTAPSAGGLLDAADIEAAADAAIATYFGTAGDGLTGIPTSGIADAVWDEVITTGHATANSAAVLLVDVPTTSEFEARTKATADYFDPATDNVRLGSILGRTLTETNADDLGDAFVNFFDVDTPAKTINDVGVSGSGLTKSDIRDALFLDAYDLAANASDGSAMGRILDSDTDGSFDWNQGTDSLDLISQVMTNLGSTISTGFGDLPTAAEIEAEVLPYFQLLARSDAAIKTDRGTQLTLLNQDQGSGAGSYDSATESAQAIRDRGDAAWDTATGFSTLDATAVQTAATAALDAYDPPTKAEMDTGFNSTLQLHTSYNFTNGSGAEAGATFQIRTP